MCRYTSDGPLCWQPLEKFCERPETFYPIWSVEGVQYDFRGFCTYWVEYRGNSQEQTLHCLWNYRKWAHANKKKVVKTKGRRMTLEPTTLTKLTDRAYALLGEKVCFICKESEWKHEKQPPVNAFQVEKWEENTSSKSSNSFYLENWKNFLLPKTA